MPAQRSTDSRTNDEFDTRRTADGRADDEFDTRRLASLTLFNSVYIGGFLHFLYQAYPPVVRAVSRAIVAPRLPWLAARLDNKQSAAHAVGCACVDNVHCGSLYIPAFYIGTGVLQGHGLGDSTATLRREWLETYIYCTAFWVPFMAGNFALVPPAWRVRAMAAANLAWVVVIDYIAHRGAPSGGGAPST